MYSTVGLGMGLCFTVTEQPHALLLEAWLSELSGINSQNLNRSGQERQPLLRVLLTCIHGIF